jgi:hypothetical protein
VAVAVVAAEAAEAAAGRSGLVLLILNFRQVLCLRTLGRDIGNLVLRLHLAVGVVMRRRFRVAFEDDDAPASRKRRDEMGVLFRRHGPGDRSCGGQLDAIADLEHTADDAGVRPVNHLIVVDEGVEVVVHEGHSAADGERA